MRKKKDHPRVAGECDVPSARSTAQTATSDVPSPAKHTPGPWTAQMQRSRRGEALGWIVETGSVRGGRIGWVDRAFADTNEGAGYEHPENEANALLVAAAPDLLDALKDMLTLYTTFDRANLKDMAGRFDAARAAIAKAEGTK